MLDTAGMLEAVELEMQQAVARAGGAGLGELHGMLAYHMGWEGEGAGPEARGKRIRPLLVMLAAQAAGGDWQAALPAAAAVELIHNFSLIHDDIEDNSPLRRGRQTLWKRWGVAQAVNTGDTLFTLAHLAVFRLEQTVSAAAALQAAHVLQQTCLHLTQGQYLDISYETRSDLLEADYWPMVGGKTAALLDCCCRLGAVAARAEAGVQQAYGDFGRLLGLAFQAQDDLLGIWGDPAVTGKSAASDLVSGKKSLPVLYGLGMQGAFGRRWRQGPVDEAEAAQVAALLAADGAQAYVQQQADQLTTQALDALEQACPQGEAGQALRDLAHKLLRRSM
ncbi:MAG: polyprenyl synthetase family protein [Chloroflexota bacterium]